MYKIEESKRYAVRDNSWDTLASELTSHEEAQRIVNAANQVEELTRRKVESEAIEAAKKVAASVE